MNLFFFDSIDRDIFGGLENWIGIVASELVNRGHQVTVAGRPGSQFLRRISRLNPGIKTLPVSISGDFNPFTIRLLKKYYEQNEIDLIVVNFNKDIRLAGLAAQLYGRARVIWRVGLDITKDNLVHRLLTPRLLDGVITPSHSLKEQIMRAGYITDDMVTVIHNGTTVKDFKRPNAEARRELRTKYGLDQQSVIAVTVGRFVNHKGHRYLIDAAPDVIAKHPEVVFLFLGDGYMRSELEQRTRDRKVTDHFVFAGMLDDIELELAGADLAIHPSIIEPFSNAVLECLRAGLPVIASRVGGMEEMITDGEGGMLVPPADSTALGKAILALLGSPGEIERLGSNARQRWQRDFTVHVMLDKVEAYFDCMRCGKVMT